MSTTHQTPSGTSIRFTSIEPIEQYSGQVREIANRHGFATEFKTEQRLSAPFCGFNYHVQDFCLIENSDTMSLDHCIDALDKLEQTLLADGFFEILE